MRAGRDEWDNPIRGGIYDGTDLTAISPPSVRTPDQAWDILPGKLHLDFSRPRQSSWKIIIRWWTPMRPASGTTVKTITDRVVDVYVDVNAMDDIVKAYVTVYKPHWISHGRSDYLYHCGIKRPSQTDNP